MPFSSDADYNFSKVSSRDALAFGSARPGYPSNEASRESVAEWAAFMKGKGVTRVLSLLSDDEKEFYSGFDIDDAMVEEFGVGCYSRTSVFNAGAKDVMTKALAKARESGECIVIHCSGGGGRAVLGMGLWLIQGYGLAPEDAVREMTEEAEESPGVERKLDATELAHLVLTGTMEGFSE